MKRLIYLGVALLICTGLYAQEPVKGIDGLDEFEASTDSTFVRQDTAFWRFYADTLFRQLPNGSMRPIPVYQADLIVWQNGARQVNRSTGVRTWRDFVEYGRQEIDARNAEIQIIIDALNGVRTFRNEWRDFLQAEAAARRE